MREPDHEEHMELAEEESPLEQFEEPAIEAPAPLDVTEEVFRAEEPIFSDDSSMDEPLPSIPLAPELDTGPSLQVASYESDPSAPLASTVAEDRHDDPLDFAGLVPP